MSGVDIMADKYGSLSPYNYAFNDPVFFNDPSGADAAPLYSEATRYLYGESAAGGVFRPRIMDTGVFGGGFMGGNFGFVQNPGFKQNVWNRIGGGINAMWSAAGANGWSTSNSSGSVAVSSVAVAIQGYGAIVNFINGVPVGVTASRVTSSGRQIGQLVNIWNLPWPKLFSNNDFWQTDAGHDVSDLGLDLLGHFSSFLGATGMLSSSTEIGLDKWVFERPDKIMNGASKLHPNFMNLSDKYPWYANRFMTGSRTLQVLKIAKVAGVVGSIASIGVSGAKWANGQATTLDKVDIGVNLVGLGTTALVAASVVSNPVGWAVGAFVLVYSGVRLYQDLSAD
jgi:hypothetical protein